MTRLAGFLDVLLHGLGLIALAVAVGGVSYVLWVLRPWQPPTLLGQVALKRSLIWMAAAGAVVALTQALQLGLQLSVLTDEPGHWPLAEFLATGFAQAGLIRVGLALGLSAAVIWLLPRLTSRTGWLGVVLLAGLLLIDGAWLVHAVGRLQHRTPLMAVTVLHQLGAAIWVGGVIHLGVLWPLAGRQPEPLWPHCLVRFSPLAILAITTLVAAGCYLSWYYIGSWDGLIGTSYGVMVLTKIALLGVGLSLGGMNFLAGRRWLRYGDSTGVQRRTPPFVEVETGIGCILLLVAASLTSLPPAVDVPAEQRASWGEVAAQFAPQLPRLSPPPLQELLAVAPSVLDTYVTHQPIEYAQSEYNHHMAGLLVLAMGLLALLERGWGLRWARHWPLLFLGLGGFLFIQAEPTVWPLGPEGFWETLFDPSVLQHRLATLLVFGLGWFEWRVQTGKFADTRRPYVFPVLCLIGGVVLLTHSHTALGFKSEFLIEVSHALLGFLAVLVGCGRWLELRLPPPANRLPGLLWTTAFLLTGVVLVFYRET